MSLHVTQRGVNRRAIFLDDDDRRDYPVLREIVPDTISGGNKRRLITSVPFVAMAMGLAFIAYLLFRWANQL